MPALSFLSHGSFLSGMDAVGLRDRFPDELMLERSPDVAELWSAESERGMVSTAHYLATSAGIEMLERGGNAVDAAVASAFALGVCESAGSGLGGMAMALVYHAASGRTFGVNGSCRGPEAATAEQVGKSRRYRGYRAVAVPRHVAALALLLERYGKLSRADVLEPAIAFAEEGFPVTRVQWDVAIEYRKHLRKSTAAPFFLNETMEPFSVGTIFRQPVLGRTLRRLEERGFGDFYRGEIAEEIVSDMNQHDGFLSRADLERAETVEECEPIWGSFDDSRVGTLGPPAGGLALIQMLQMASCLPKDQTDLTSAMGVLRVASIIRHARRDRIRYRLRMGTDSLGEAAVLVEESYARDAAGSSMKEVGPKPPRSRHRAPSGETSHIAVMDRDGNVVSLTQSIERSFGSAVVTPSLGFVYNGYLRAFKIQNVAHPHYLRPGAPARSNAAPTIAFRAGKPWLSVGNTGSERMCSGIFEVFLRLRDETPFAAVHGPRLHCTPTSHVLWEEERFPQACRKALLERGFSLEPLDPYSFKVGGLHLTLRKAERFVGVAEPRRDGSAGGPER